MREYMRRPKSTIAEYIAGKTIHNLCTGADKMEVFSQFLHWWDQEHGPTQAERGVG